MTVGCSIVGRFITAEFYDAVGGVGVEPAGAALLINAVIGTIRFERPPPSGRCHSEITPLKVFTSFSI